ncbi:MAG: hypothetical protein EWM72_00062 [Nitrospira sp.]|nr:MAG: hypothetical protein EWM72_00062 [Nitrospira sp.]
MHLLLLTALFFILWVSGCRGPIMPISNGSMSDLPSSALATVVWGQHKGAVGEAVTTLQQLGFRIVERSRLQQVFDEQKITLTHSTDDDAQLLKVGKILGAGSIVFVEIETSSSQTTRGFVNKYGGGMRSEMVTNASVSVRGVDVESGEVIWTGTAHYPSPINNPEAGIVYLTRSAVRRGLCPPWGWKNDAEGCDATKAFGTGVIGIHMDVKNMPEGRQLLVTAVRPNSPAEQAGFKAGDVILSCNGKSGFQTRMQYYAACKTDAGQPLTLQVKRGDKLTTISATAVSRTESQQ